MKQKHCVKCVILYKTFLSMNMVYLELTWDKEVDLWKEEEGT